MTIVTETSRGTPNVRKIDRVIAAVLLIFLALAFLAPGQVFHSFQFITKALAGISIFLAVSVLAASFAKATGLDQQITLVFSGRPMQAILLASLFGSGTTPVTGETSWGDVPQVTSGSISFPSIFISLSNLQFLSEYKVFQ